MQVHESQKANLILETKTACFVSKYNCVANMIRSSWRSGNIGWPDQFAHFVFFQIAFPTLINCKFLLILNQVYFCCSSRIPEGESLFYKLPEELPEEEDKCRSKENGNSEYITCYISRPGINLNEGKHQLLLGLLFLFIYSV